VLGYALTNHTGEYSNEIPKVIRAMHAALTIFFCAQLKPVNKK